MLSIVLPIFGGLRDGRTAGGCGTNGLLRFRNPKLLFSPSSSSSSGIHSKARLLAFNSAVFMDI